MKKYKSITRTTLEHIGESPLPHAGVYIIAYMGRILYVGKSNDSVIRRLSSHLERADIDDIGGWMYKNRYDWHNTRIDVLEAPDNIDINFWLREVENALVKKFSPLFNVQLMA